MRMQLRSACEEREIWYLLLPQSVFRNQLHTFVNSDSETCRLLPILVHGNADEYLLHGNEVHDMDDAVQWQLIHRSGARPSVNDVQLRQKLVYCLPQGGTHVTALV